ncbi:hypothetical protein ACQPZF_32095 [Actinosynnema sp. CS-041913]|uniref:hypothetical protein n=1 Tax=Actinosynnema sp. CS-041913 TaxID=3239917 RepID=UPI003D8DF1E6
MSDGVSRRRDLPLSRAVARRVVRTDFTRPLVHRPVRAAPDLEPPVRRLPEVA